MLPRVQEKDPQDRSATEAEGEAKPSSVEKGRKKVDRRRREDEPESPLGSWSPQYVRERFIRSQERKKRAQNAKEKRGGSLLVDAATYEKALEIFREMPGSINVAAKKLGIGWETANRLWHKGIDRKDLCRPPIKEVFSEEWIEATFAAEQRRKEALSEVRQKAVANLTEYAARMDDSREILKVLYRVLRGVKFTAPDGQERTFEGLQVVVPLLQQCIVDGVRRDIDQGKLTTKQAFQLIKDVLSLVGGTQEALRDLVELEKRVLREPEPAPATEAEHVLSAVEPTEAEILDELAAVLRALPPEDAPTAEGDGQDEAEKKA